MAGRYEVEDQSVVEFQLGNKQLLLLFVGLLVICAIFFFIGLRVGEDTARSKSALVLGDEADQPAELAESAARDAGALTLRTGSATTPTPKTQRRQKPQPQRTAAQEPRAASANTAAAGRPAQGNAGERTATSIPARGYYLQVASPTDESSAHRLQATLASAHPTIVQPVVVKGRKHFRVRVGPFSTSAEALEFKRSLGDKHKDAIVAKL